MNSKTITIYLLDGDPTGAKTVELSNFTGKGYLIPINKIEEVLNDKENQEELGRQCVYFLHGESEDGKKSVYVGEAESFISRINQHKKNLKKDFWNMAICFMATDKNLTKADVKYLENRIVEKIKEANRVILENSSTPAETKLPRPDKARAEEFLQNIEIMLSSLGYTFLQAYKKTDDNLFFCQSKKIDANAAGMLVNEGFVVFPVSKISKQESPSISKGLLKLRKDALNKSLLKDAGDFFILTNEYIFTSPSYAAGFVLGRNSNGWVEWKTRSGKTLDEIKRKPNK